MLSSLVLPVTSAQAKRAQAPKLDLSEISVSSKVRMAGNGMNVPTIGLILLFAVLSLEKR